jgi:hypothetical protein
MKKACSDLSKDVAVTKIIDYEVGRRGMKGYEAQAELYRQEKNISQCHIFQ